MRPSDVNGVHLGSNAAHSRHRPTSVRPLASPPPSHSVPQRISGYEDEAITDTPLLDIEHIVDPLSLHGGHLDLPNEYEKKTILMYGNFPPPPKAEEDGEKVISKQESRKREPLYQFFTLSDIAHGCWYDMHFFASNGERETLEGQLALYAKRFKCVKCRMHLRKYLNENPFPPKCYDTGLDALASLRSKRKDATIMFNWTVKFHNAVSKRVHEENNSNNEPCILLTEEGAKALFHELTIGADESETLWLESEGKDCAGGCNGPDQPKEVKPPPSKQSSHNSRWVAY